MQVLDTNNYVDEFGFIHHNSGKTWAGGTAIAARFLQSPGINQAYYAPTYPHIRDIFFPTIEEVAHGLGLRVEIMQANKEVHFHSTAGYRGTVICRSMERPESIIGYKVGHSLVDELDTLPTAKACDAWRKIIARLRWSGASNGVDVTTTPEGFRETHRLFVAQLADKPAMTSLYGLVQASTRDNARNLPEGYIDSLFDTYPEELRNAYIDGQFCNLTSGTVYGSYDRIRCRSREAPRIGETIHVGMDFNVGKMAAVLFVVRGDGWHAVGELCDVFDTPTMCRMLKERYAQHSLIVYPDASGGSRKTNDASTSDISIIEQHGFQVRAHASNPAVRDRVLSVNRQFEQARLWVNEALCPTVARCLEQQSYDTNGEPDKKSGFDHANDAFGYPVAYNFPITRPVARYKIGGV